MAKHLFRDMFQEAHQVFKVIDLLVNTSKVVNLDNQLLIDEELTYLYSLPCVRVVLGL